MARGAPQARKAAELAEAERLLDICRAGALAEMEPHYRRFVEISHSINRSVLTETEFGARLVLLCAAESVEMARAFLSWHVFTQMRPGRLAAGETPVVAVRETFRLLGLTHSRASC